MKTLVSFQALAAALAASVGLQACGGDSKGGESETGSGGRTGVGGNADRTGGRAQTGGRAEANGGADTGGRSDTGGRADTGGRSDTGGRADTGGRSDTGGRADTGGRSEVTGGTTSTGGVTGEKGGRACADPTPILTGDGRPTGLESCSNGGSHRVEPVECAIHVPRADATCTANPNGVANCETDADCTDRDYGWCGAQPQAQIPTCACSYGCETDADCNGGVCVCSGDMGRCAAAQCRTDADCDDGFECRSFKDPSNSLCESTRFECQTAEDTCGGDADCTGTELCVADATGAHHCQRVACAVPGRPFFVEGQQRTAQPASRLDWADDCAVTGGSALTADDRCALADYFTRAALLEHASVAAFARFALELLHFGAPLELVAAAQRAMGDELEHARACFTLASRYDGRGVGPGPLSVTGCLDQLSLEAAVRAAVREGCVGETVAAVQAAEALAHCRDAEVVAALARIRHDEWEHAELAFRFVRWALELDPALAGPVLDELEAAAPGEASPREATDSDRRRAENGLLPEAHLARIACRVHAEMVAPVLSSLVAETRTLAA